MARLGPRGRAGRVVAVSVSVRIEDTTAIGAKPQTVIGTFERAVDKTPALERRKAMRAAVRERDGLSAGRAVKHDWLVKQGAGKRRIRCDLTG